MEDLTYKMDIEALKATGQVGSRYIYIFILGGGFKYFLFSPLFGEGFQFD